MIPANDLTNILTTLITNGFNIAKVERFANSNNIIHVYKYDKLGAEVKYSILFTLDKKENSIIETLLSVAGEFKATPIIVSDEIKLSDCKCYSRSEFFNFFGGILNTGLILIPKLSEVLDLLGHKKLPKGLTGKPENLHELYVKECLQFIMESPTRRYGIDRSFESLPDAVVLSKEGFMLLVDSKSYSNGFGFEADDLKRFKSYVEEFRLRYSFFYGSVLSFLIISGGFTDSQTAINSRSDELYKMANCKLSYMTSRELGAIVELVRENTAMRSSINWRNIFSQLMIDTKLVEKEIKRIEKDNIH